jgi:[NiFe] hydrogenase assembly HybE family chaperone
MAEPAEIAARLEALYREVEQTRMQGVPILNSRLRVEAVGMRPWQEMWLCALVTPWFINFMLLPKGDAVAAEWGKLKISSSQQQIFPSGPLGFIVAEAQAMGRYQMCSLFSPVLEFEDQAAAKMAAEAVMTALFEEATVEEPAPVPVPEPKALSRRGLFGVSRTGSVAE